MRAAVLACIVIAGCWRDGPGPAPTPLRPTPTSPEPETSRRPRWRQKTTNVTVGPPADQPRTREQIAHQLATDLWTSGAHLLPSYVAGPIVVMDLDTGTLTTVCDPAAATAAQAWGAMLNGPAPLAHCRGGQTFTCHQFSKTQILIVELADPDQWRLVSVIVGNFRTGRTTMASKMGQMRSLIANAACP